MQRISHKLLLAMAIVLLVVVFAVVLNTINFNKINYGTEISNISIGEFSRQGAADKLNTEITKLFDQNFNLVYKNYVWTI
ncbi:MAG: hypothetical protein NT058_00415, partial [Candidatus Portnoybacteria bacterium]|nr:hypothetical protein [Candidatus Portnoybacteria bacterium]